MSYSKDESFLSTPCDIASTPIEIQCLFAELGVESEEVRVGLK